MSKVRFYIDQKKYLKINLPSSDPYKSFRYDEATITFTQNGKDKYILYKDDFIIHALRELTASLEMLLNNNLKLHPSITRNIGYLWNQDLYGRKKLIYNICEGIKFWVGQRHLMWNHRKISTWIYEKDSHYFLEITPTYQWPTEEQKKQGYITYREFMRKYKPYEVIPLSKETVEQWLDTATALLTAIENNDHLYLITPNNE